MARLFFNKTELQLWRDTLIAQLQHLHQPFKIFLTLLLAITIPNMASADTRCENPAAILESAEGAVEWAAGDNDTWQKAERGASFCYGDKVRVVEQRAALRLANETLVRLQENSLITLLPEEKGFWFGLIEGAGHFLSRTPKQFTIKAPYLNAAVDGTEFVVIAQPQENRVAVVEGAVRVNNDFGEVHLSEGTQTSATANSPPSAVQSIRLRDAAEWVLYYPPLIVQISAPAQIETLIQQENYAEALAQLTAAELTPETAALAASLAYHIGNTSQGEELLTQILHKSPNQAEALALQALRTLINGDSEDALARTTQLISTHPKKPSVLLAHAYAQQSHGNIEEALKTNLQAQALIPDNLFVLARTAELQLSVGNTRAAQKLINKALSQAPQHSRLNTLAGFIALNRFATSKAQNHFQAAITSNSNEPLARLGLALALIQKGKIDEGRAQMEMAVLLDPTSSLLRSYLGKTYATQNQNDWADTQYQLAKNLDPNDPTPWFYQAHLKHEENKPGEALRLITTAIEKNDNRAVYRSRMLLDSDVAARSANQVNIYKKFGLHESAKYSAGENASENPEDYGARYATVVAFNDDSNTPVLIARESFIARLQAPIGTKELSVGISETGLLILPWVSPSHVNTHEYTSLYSPRGMHGNAKTFLGNQNSRGYQWQLQNVSSRTSISAGQYDYQTDGYRENNDLNAHINEIVLQHQHNDSLKLLITGTTSEERFGDLINAVNSPSFDDNIRKHHDLETILLGGAYQLPARTTLFLSAGHSDASYETQTYVPIFPQPDNWYAAKLLNTEKRWEMRFLKRSQLFQWSIGFGEENISITESEYGSPFFVDPEQEDLYRKLTEQKAYLDAFFNTRLPIQFAAGVGINSIEDRHTKREKSVTEYKIGSIAHPTPKTSITLATWQSLGSYIPRAGSLEDRFIFNIPMENNTSLHTESRTSAASSAWRSDRSHVAISARTSAFFVPKEIGLRTIEQKIDETVLSLAAEHTLSNQLTITSKISAQRDHAGNLDETIAIENEPQKANTRSGLLGINYLPLSNIHFGLTVNFINQSLHSYIYDEKENIPPQKINTTHWNANALYTHKRSGVSIEIKLHNITNQKDPIFHKRLYEVGDLINTSIIETPPQRTVLAALKYAF
jgi:Flp pilus assembly protein TadD, contains TPR repeats